MLELLAYVVLFWFIMPALLLGLGKLISFYATDKPRSSGIFTREKTPAVKDFLGSVNKY